MLVYQKVDGDGLVIETNPGIKFIHEWLDVGWLMAQKLSKSGCSSREWKRWTNTDRQVRQTPFLADCVRVRRAKTPKESGCLHLELHMCDELCNGRYRYCTILSKDWNCLKCLSRQEMKDFVQPSALSSSSYVCAYMGIYIYIFYIYILCIYIYKYVCVCLYVCTYSGCFAWGWTNQITPK